MSIYLKAIAAKTVILKQGSLLSSKCHQHAGEKRGAAGLLLGRTAGEGTGYSLLENSLDYIGPHLVPEQVGKV